MKWEKLVSGLQPCKRQKDKGGFDQPNIQLVCQQVSNLVNLNQNHKVLLDTICHTIS